MMTMMIIIIHNDDTSNDIKDDEDTDNRYDSIKRPHSIKRPVRLVSAPSILFCICNHMRPSTIKD